jgi:lysyl-tRNA synthetase class 2
MSHLIHLAKNKENLTKRAHILRWIRTFFESRDFVEISAPTILQSPGQEPYLSPIPLQVHNERGEEFKGYLHTSPEYMMKKCLAAGFGNIYSMGPCYRDYESFGGTHNPEFTMIEWYRPDVDYTALMEDTENLVKFIANEAAALGWKNETITFVQQPWERLSMRDAWKRYAGVDLDNCLTVESMKKVAEKKGYFITPKDEHSCLRRNDNISFEDLFFKIFLNEIEPKIGHEKPTIIYDYPSPLAALARLSSKDPRYAERIEVYIQNLELANGYSELTDAAEQLRRLEAERAFRIDRKQNGQMSDVRCQMLDVFPIDQEFIEAVKQMPPAAGIALGVDRLVQLITGCKNIDDVIPLPMSKLFQK